MLFRLRDRPDCCRPWVDTAFIWIDFIHKQFLSAQQRLPGATEAAAAAVTTHALQACRARLDAGQAKAARAARPLRVGRLGRSDLHPLRRRRRRRGRVERGVLYAGDRRGVSVASGVEEQEGGGGSSCRQRRSRSARAVRILRGQATPRGGGGGG